jgi:voltage-gated potassium channel Kch
VFQLKATNEKYPIRTFFLIAIIFVLTFAFMIRIWERPYYEFALAEPFYEFRYIGSSLWYTLISMTTVGYGNIVATTPYGRVSVVCAIIVGSFLLSQQVGLLINLITLKDNEENTIN